MYENIDEKEFFISINLGRGCDFVTRIAALID